MDPANDVEAVPLITYFLKKLMAMGQIWMLLIITERYELSIFRIFRLKITNNITTLAFGQCNSKAWTQIYRFRLHKIFLNFSFFHFIFRCTLCHERVCYNLYKLFYGNFITFSCSLTFSIKNVKLLKPKNWHFSSFIEFQI